MTKVIEVPDFLRHLKLDPRGHPHPFLMMSDSIFTMDGRKQERCVREKLCMICGRKLDNKKWFVGGPRTAINRLVVDPAMHERCARYSLKVCPFLANQDMKHRARYDADTKLISTVAPERDGGQFLLRTNGSHPIMLNGTVFLLCNRWDYIEHWRNGEISATPPDYTVEQLSDTVGACDRGGSLFQRCKRVEL